MTFEPGFGSSPPSPLILNFLAAQMHIIYLNDTPPMHSQMCLDRSKGGGGRW
jgi:hypothetical protein